MPSIVHGTLVATTVTDVTVNPLDAIEEQDVEMQVVNVDGSAAIYYTLNGSAPSVEGDDCYVLPAAICSRAHQRRSVEAVTVRLVSAGTPKFCVEGT